MADLNEFYPSPTQTSPNGAGAAASPGATSSSSTMAGGIGGAPAVWVLAFVGVSLLLLHVA